MTRLKYHGEIADELQCWSNEGLLHLLNDAQIQVRGHGTLSFLNDRTPVFVKLVPLAALEMSGQNYQSTANYFQLPTYYQYRIGSCGFGAWREIETHLVANTWVKSGQCAQFPLLHHWRVLPIVCTSYDDRIDRQRWGNCEAIHQRVSSMLKATHSVVIFLEHYPLTLSQWLRHHLLHCTDPISMITSLETQLTDILSFINSQGVIHMDAHFNNILTDGNQLLLADYGLALSNQFQLDADECQFFDEHQNFDICTVITSLVHAIVSCYDSRDNWRQALQQLANEHHGSNAAISVDLRAYLSKRMALVMKMGAFYRQLLADLTTPYPAADLQAILDNL
ncbi:hypothetical protein D0962_03080 [Leptolyngbyaceae cyanobacterium CCMR0082]|uniref:Protein kinase domain-containing protein n=1 Tax=Adonisia turfae CCMR0082 TaxID=2304604 RepID=A0A6M0RZY5_9CYAN|nr:hypothetical protein [Adonisia turfae]NEZ61767.1 hypothetical protein [Adonisia turfae CCMR0082]